jgi:hypothetical protein
MEIPKHRQRVCFAHSGGDSMLSEKRLGRFVSSCHQMRLLREEREERRLQRLKQLALRFETITLFKSWSQYVRCRQLHRRHALQQHWQLWRGQWLLRRYSILLLLANQTKPILRSALRLWRSKTLHLRAICFYHRTLSRRLFELLKLLLRHSSRRLLEKCLQRWKLWLLLIKKLRRLVLLLCPALASHLSKEIFFRLMPRVAFLHWKACTFRTVDLSPVLERIRLRVLEEAFYFLWRLSEKLKHERLLASLPTRAPTLEVAPIEVPTAPAASPLRTPKKTRKAALDTWRTPCRCV